MSHYPACRGTATGASWGSLSESIVALPEACELSGFVCLTTVRAKPPVEALPADGIEWQTRRGGEKRRQHEVGGASCDLHAGR